MMLSIDNTLTPAALEKKLSSMFEAAAQKIAAIENSWDPSRGTPVYTVKGQYTSRGWTEWTQGFQFGSMTRPMRNGFLNQGVTIP
jgi:hypothetical protein